MEKLNHPAILVVDMLNDFVTGAIGCDRARAIVPATARLLAAAREKGVPVIYCNDCHLPGIDRELQIWGDHAIKGTPGAEVIPELTPQPCGTGFSLFFPLLFPIMKVPPSTLIILNDALPTLNTR